MKQAIDSELGRALYAGTLRQTFRHRRAGVWQTEPFLRPSSGEKWVFLQPHREAKGRAAFGAFRLSAGLGHGHQHKSQEADESCADIECDAS
jgi:hypothetical protein